MAFFNGGVGGGRNIGNVNQGVPSRLTLAPRPPDGLFPQLPGATIGNIGSLTKAPPPFIDRRPETPTMPTLDELFRQGLLGGGNTNANQPGQQFQGAPLVGQTFNQIPQGNGGEFFNPQALGNLGQLDRRRGNESFQGTGQREGDLFQSIQRVLSQIQGGGASIAQRFNGRNIGGNISTGVSSF